MEKDYEVLASKLKEYLPDKVDKLPIRVLSPLCKWKRRKGDNKMPLKHTNLLVRWHETKHREDITLEEFLTMMTAVFNTYNRMTKGGNLTMAMIEDKLQVDHHNVAIGDTMTIVHDHGSTDVVIDEAVIHI